MNRQIIRLRELYRLDFNRIVFYKDSSYYNSEPRHEAVMLKDDEAVLELFAEAHKGMWPGCSEFNVCNIVPHDKPADKWLEEANTEEVKLYAREYSEYQRLKAKFEGK